MPSATAQSHLHTICEDALSDLVSSERTTTDQTLVSIGIVVRDSAAPQWSVQRWLDDGDFRRSKSLQAQIQKAVRRAFDSDFGSFLLDPAGREHRNFSEPQLFFSYVASTDFGQGDTRLIVWGVSIRLSPTGFTPLRLRELIHLLTVEFQMLESRKRDASMAAQLVSAGDTVGALDILCQQTLSSAAILWYYDDIGRTFESVDAAGVIDQRRYSVESAFGHALPTSAGIVGQIRPEIELVVYDAHDRSVWQPSHIAGWRPQDERAFVQNRWRSCVAWPLSFTGRLVGALSIYSTEGAEGLVPAAEKRKLFSTIFTGILEGTRIERQYLKLAGLFDEEVSRASLSVLALGYIHDIVARHEALTANITQAELEVVALQTRHVSTPALSRALENAQSDLDSIDSMIQQMRRVARDAQMPDDLGWCNAASVAEELGPFLDMAVRRVSVNRLRRCKLVIRASTEQFDVPIPRSRLERILVNLATNAAQWSASTLTVTLSRQGSVVSVEVADDGIGIDPRDAPRIFDLFFSRRSGGSGLGLYLVRKFAVEAGGSVSVDSKPYAGTVLLVRLPAGRSKDGEGRR